MSTPFSLQTNPLLSQWIRVREDGDIEVFTGKVEIGQGIVHSLHHLAVQALGYPPERVHLVPANTQHSPDEGMTAGSLSVQHSGVAIVHACVHARHLLSQSPRVDDHDWQVPVRTDLPLPPLTQDTPVRDELRALLQGEAYFLADQLPAKTWFGRVLRPRFVRFHVDAKQLPAAQARVKDLSVQLLHDGDLLGVVGADEAQVHRAAERLLALPLWQAEPHGLSPHDWADRWPTQAAQTTVFHEAGEASASPDGTLFAAHYTKPFLHHASIGPSAACALWQVGEHPDAPPRLMVWSHSQGIHALRRDLALALRIDAAQVQIQHARHAGCYGHNGADDVAFDAAWMARQCPGTPVFVQWSRQDEMACSPVGAGMRVQLRARLSADHQLLSWQHEVFSQGHSSRPGRAPTPALLGGFQVAEPHPRLEPINMPAAVGAGAERNSISPYRTAHQKVINHRLLGLPFRTSSLRSLGAQANVFASESFVDEICHARGLDPWQQRLDWLDDARGRAVLQALGESCDWTARRAALSTQEGRGIGLAYARYKGTGAYCAVAAEVEVAEVVKVHTLWVVADLGHVVSHSGARLQLEGGAIQATSWTLKEAVQWDELGFTSVDWDHYPILRFSEVPTVHVQLIEPPGEPSLGAGEATQAPTSAAIANAVFHALGVRVRELPLTPEVIARAM